MAYKWFDNSVTKDQCLYEGHNKLIAILLFSKGEYRLGWVDNDGLIIEDVHEITDKMSSLNHSPEK